MTPGLDLNNRSSRRVGMNRSGYQFPESLHVSRPQSKGEDQSTNVDILAPPQDSSDEASIGEGEDGISSHLGSTADRHRRGSSSTKEPVAGKSCGSSPPLGGGELSCTPSTIPATKWATSQNSQKRSIDVIDDIDDGMGTFANPPKKCRTSYGMSSQRSTQDNIHHNSAKDRNQKPVKKFNASENGNAKRSIRLLPDTDELMARGW